MNGKDNEINPAIQLKIWSENLYNKLSHFCCIFSFLEIANSIINVNQRIHKIDYLCIQLQDYENKTTVFLFRITIYSCM